MNVILCLDDSEGMMFNGRRQSRDEALRQRIQQLCTGHQLWMNFTSFKIYGGLENTTVNVDDDFLEKASEGDYCLVETEHLEAVEADIEKLIIFWWNRKYPADFSLDLELKHWEVTSVQEFPGNSHEKITEKIYIRKGK